MQEDGCEESGNDAFVGALVVASFGSAVTLCGGGAVCFVVVVVVVKALAAAVGGASWLETCMSGNLVVWQVSGGTVDNRYARKFQLALDDVLDNRYARRIWSFKTKMTMS